MAGNERDPIIPAMRQLLAGPGVHGGRPCRLEMRIRNAGAAFPEFSFPALPGPVSIGDLARLPRLSRRATVLGLPGAPETLAPASPSADQGYPARYGSPPAAVETPEHLLAALLFFSEVPLSIRADAAELPGLDGSALPFREALARLAPEAARAPAWREYPCGLAWEDRWADGYLRIRPAPGFRVRYELDRGPLRQACVLEDPAAAWSGILPARTFAFHDEWLAASAAGLMAGAGRESGLLLARSEAEHRALLARHPDWEGAPYPLLNLPAWRMPDEPVRHKILDLLGDLALRDLALPRASIEIRNGGHASHHRLLARLLEC